MKTKEGNDLHMFQLKAERFCAYQERCSSEVRQKMKECNADEKTIEVIMASLGENGFQNDERFAILFSSGKFRIKKWGKNKIRAELKARNIPDSFITKGLDSISEEEYRKTLMELIKKKERELKNKNSKNTNQKIGMYLLSKGYEAERIWKCINLKT